MFILFFSSSPFCLLFFFSFYLFFSFFFFFPSYFKAEGKIRRPSFETTTTNQRTTLLIIVAFMLEQSQSSTRNVRNAQIETFCIILFGFPKAKGFYRRRMESSSLITFSSRSHDLDKSLISRRRVYNLVWPKDRKANFRIKIRNCSLGGFFSFSDTPSSTLTPTSPNHRTHCKCVLFASWPSHLCLFFFSLLLLLFSFSFTSVCYFLSLSLSRPTDLRCPTDHFGFVFHFCRRKDEW